MRHRTWMIIFGIFDCALFLSIILRNVLSGDVPFYSEYMEFSSAWRAFFDVGYLHHLYWIGIIPVILVYSTIITGFLLIKNRRAGVILSVIHAPFRLLLISLPSFGLISYIYSQFDISGLYVVFLIVYCLEIAKTYVLVKIYRSFRN